jgi:sensor histidine kinase YesM
VENAIKYGVERTSSAGRITIRARRDGGWLLIQVADDGVGPAEAARTPRNRSGRGLSNARERLMRLYGERQRLELSSGPGGRGAVVEVRLPYRQISRVRMQSAEIRAASTALEQAGV